MLAKILFSTLLISLSTVVHAQDMDIVGTWKTIDEQTGYSRADVVISKNADQSYSGKIIKIRPLPYKALVETCSKCKGKLKDAPYVGLEILSGFKQDAKNPKEYIDGHVLDPLSGKIYRGKAKLSPNGQRLSLRGYVGVSALGKSTTWLRADK